MFEQLTKTLEKKGFCVSVFPTGEEAAAYLNQQIDHTTVGMGGSATLTQLGLYQSLSTHNVVFRHGSSPIPVGDAHRMAANAEIYLLSANGIAEDSGEIISIDGTGNRVASSLFGHRKVYFVAGSNKVSPDFASALHRVRNVVAPQNARRLNRKTPCAVNADRCYNCCVPDRICRGMVVHMAPMMGMEMEVVLVEQELGF